MTVHNFSSPTPAKLYVELMNGEVVVQTSTTSETTVTLTGRNSDQIVVTQEGDEISVIGPKLRGILNFSFDRGPQVTITAPIDSQIIFKSGSADLKVTGRITAAQVKSGSGDVSLEEVSTLVDVATGSGDVALKTSLGPLTFKTGSGDINVTSVHGPTRVTAGSGDILIRELHDSVNIKTGSGDIRLGHVHAGATVHSGSGDLYVEELHGGTLVNNSGSGDVRVGVAPSIPVWTDINTITGTIRSSLNGAGKPESGQDHIEIRARSASGDITLVEA